MPRKLLFTLIVSIAAHVAVVVVLDQPVTQQRIISTGSLKAPIFLSFSSDSQPVPESVTKQHWPEPKPEPVKKPLPTPVKKEKPMLKKTEAVNVKPKSKPKSVAQKEPESEVKKEPEQKPKPEAAVTAAVTRVAVTQTALKKTQAEGLSAKPVMVAEPSVRNWKHPRYPALARRRNQQGTVMLDVVVDEKGHPELIEILKSSGFSALDRAAIASVERWEFEPEQRNKRFVKSRVHIPVVFRLN